MNNLLAEIKIGDELILDTGKNVGAAAQFQSLGAMVSILLKNVYVIAGVLLLFLLIFGGISIIMSAGSGDAKKIAQGQKTVTNALIGFLVIFASYWIIQIIDILTGLNILEGGGL